MLRPGCVGSLTPNASLQVMPWTPFTNLDKESNGKVNSLSVKLKIQKKPIGQLVPTRKLQKEIESSHPFQLKLDDVPVRRKVITTYY